MDGLHVRPAEAPDVLPIVAMEAESFPAPWSDTQIAPYVGTQQPAALVAVLCGSSCGYLLCRLVLDEAEIDRVGVDPGNRRRGIGRALLHRCLHDLEERGVKRVWLEVASSNAPAIGLYESLGFEAVDTRHGYYGAPSGLGRGSARQAAVAPEDALMMRLALQRQTETLPA